ncbi:carboxypeptidase-like regulatory domain-containing protein [Paramuribaculum intestinale]|uniref:TonB-dependent receptor n=1 Tax=Paramuribaculum intestinale TaxID=2094151 RepID=UPI0025A97331|nr:carboxypeptidase-like regulatory domain-containing protein [Paramuribaculum intestinale]
MKRLFLLGSVIWLLCVSAFAAPDIKCTGTLVDEEGEPMVGATVSVPGTSRAAAANIDGIFTINVPEGKNIKITYIGYKTLELPARSDMGTITMYLAMKHLDDVVVTQSVGKTRETPVAMSTVGADAIDFKLGGQELMEVLKTTPGIYTIRQGGGFGDAETRMRGFKSANVAMMVNGIPINDMEWGGVYQSNWAGLSDVASNIQTQRGLGATIVSTPSIGGTINITTRTIDVERGGSVWYGMGNDGMNNYGVKVSTGLMKNGWAVTFLGSHKWGDGYVQGTQYNAYNYFFNVSKRLTSSHQLSLTAFGAPQQHYQRSSYDGLSVLGWQAVKNYMDGESMYRYNPTYGFDNQGRQRTSNYNVYHKPQISLGHIWQIDHTQSLSTSLYMSYAQGYGLKGYGRNGYSSDWYGSSNGVLNTKFRCPDGTFDYGAIQDMNAASATGSNMVMARQNNNHEWYGLVSSYKKRIDLRNGDRLNLIGGLDLRYYIGHHKNKISDLYDGAYYLDDSNRGNVRAANNALAANPDWKYQKLGVGDVIARNYNGYTAQEGAYAQAEYTTLSGKLNLVLSGALNNNTYWRRDFFYYDKEHEKSKTMNFIGGTVKGGVNYNIDRHNNVFFNTGYISRAPFFSGGVFLNSNYSNVTNPNAVNEKVYSFEAGYGLQTRKVAFTFNAYLTRWMDRTMARSGEIESGPHAGDRYYMNMEGVDARHMGLEFNVKYIPVKWMELDGMFSLGDWQWDSNATGYFYNQNGEPLKNLQGDVAAGILADDHLRTTLLQKGMKVGGSAQTTAAVGVVFKPFDGFRIGADWTAAARNYSDINITTSSLQNNGELSAGDPWRIPWGNQLDLSCSYRFKIGGVNATLYGNVHNLFDYNYITQAYTPVASDGTWENAYQTFYSFGRTFSVRMRVNF